MVTNRADRGLQRIADEIVSRLSTGIRPTERLIDELEFMHRLGISSRETFDRYKEHPKFPPSVVPYASKKRAPQARYREETVNDFIRTLDREAWAKRLGEPARLSVRRQAR